MERISQVRFSRLMLAVMLLWMSNSIGIQSAPSGGPPAWLQDLFKAAPEIRDFHVSDFPIMLRIYRLNDAASSRFSLTLVFVVLPARSFKLSIEDVRKVSTAAAVFSRLGNSKDNVVLVNGGFYGLHNNRGYPIGLIVSRGQKKNLLCPWRTGGVLFASTMFPAGIVKIGDFAESADVQEALQSKLLLVEDSVSGIHSDDHQLANRTVVGIRKDGSVVVAGAFSDDNNALSLYEFAQVLTNLKLGNMKGMEFAFYADGGPSAHISIPVLDLQFGTAGAMYVPNLIRFSVPQ